MQNRYAVVLGVVLAVSGCRTVEPAPPPDAPRVTSFSASKSRVAAGEEVTLTFTSEGATKVELADDSGRFVRLEGENGNGTATVAPTRTSFYVLRATGVGGRDTAFVQIAVNEPLKDLFLIAVPGTIDSGDQAQLLWGAPGASEVTLKVGSGTPQALTGTTGTVLVTPSVTEQYTLTAQGAPGTPPITALARIQVRPVLQSAELTAAEGVLAGKTLRFTWSTAGAARVTLTERTFGLITTVTDAAAVAQGTYDFVLPATLPTGVSVADGLPLRFVVAASAGDENASKSFDAVVGDLPVIEQLVAPEFVTNGGTMTVSWRTLNATKVTVRTAGLPIFSTPSGAQARVTQGSLTLPSPSINTEFVLEASNDRGAVATRAFNVRPVALPVINTYTLTPTLNAFGDPATARWTTSNATRIVVRLENGATLGIIETPSQVASGQFSFTPATSVSVTLEAFNAAGDKVSQVKPVTFQAAVVTVVPTPVVRGLPATLNWNFGAMTEVVGLPTAVPAPVTTSPNFIDLSTAAGVEELEVFDPSVGAERIPLPAGFSFPMLGQVRPDLFVSVDGFIAFARPATTLVINADLTTSTTAPSMLAPFWDDLLLATTSKLLWTVQRNTSGERLLIVQWDKLQQPNDPASEFTFQAQLFETGQVVFVYKTMTGALNSATIGVKDTSWPYSHIYSHNSATTQAAADLELNYFSGGPATGSVAVGTTRSYRVSFFGRTGTGVVPASAEVRTFTTGDFTITEAMPIPEANVITTGQWVEIRNNADASVNLGGLVLYSGGSTDGGYVISDSTIAPPYGYVVLGQSTLASANGGAPVTEAWSDVALDNPGNVQLRIGTVALASLAWDAGLPGRSISSIEGGLVAAGASPICTATLMSTFGPNGAVGTPGARNEGCVAYTITPIDGGYIDISSTGTVLIASGSPYTGVGNVALGTPFTYYGQSYSSFDVGMVGFITFGHTLASGDFDPSDVIPSTATPNGVVAPFWEWLVRNTNGKILKLERADRTIISWQDFRLYATSTSLSFQIHLLPGGILEFHYGNFTGATSQVQRDQLEGSKATSWLERPDGTFAQPLSVDQMGIIGAGKAYRFTPAN